MRRFLMIGCAAIALHSLPAVALTEPNPIRTNEQGGDERVRQAYWRSGKVIQLIGSKGQSLMVEMPKGMTLDSYDVSQQNIITPPSVEFIEVDEQGRPINNAPPKIEKEEGCVKTIDIKICVKRDRFLFFVPYTDLDAQPFPFIMLEKKKVGKKEEEIEHSIIFELSTAEKDARPYYGVKVVVGDPPAPPPPVVAPAAPSVPRETPMASGSSGSSAELLLNRNPVKSVVSIPPRPGMPKRDREQLKSLQMERAKPPEMNNNYTLQGDINLIGR